MDEMIIGSRLMRGIFAKLAKRAIRKKLGYDIELELNELNVKIVDGTAHAHLSIDTVLSNDELNKILAKVGL